MMGRVICIVTIFMLFLVRASIVHADETCPDGIGSTKGDAPFLVVHSASKRWNLIFCGDDFNKLRQGVYKASEYEVIRSDNNYVPIMFGALDNTYIYVNANDITIKLADYLPLAGNNWQWTAYTEYKLELLGDKRLKEECKRTLNLPKLTAKQALEIVSDYEKSKHKPLEEDKLDRLLVRLMVAATSGNVKAQRAFSEARHDPRVDGAVLEFYVNINSIYMEAINHAPKKCGFVNKPAEDIFKIGETQ